MPFCWFYSWTGHQQSGSPETRIVDVQLCSIFMTSSSQRKKPANAKEPRSCAAARSLQFLTIPYDYCGVWIRNVPHRLMNPYTISSRWCCVRGGHRSFRGRALLEGVQHLVWALRIYNLHLFPVPSLCARRNVISLLPVPVSMSSLPTVPVCPSGTTN